MPDRSLRLNTLQAKTLTLLQELAKQSVFAEEDVSGGGKRIRALPDPHGDHFHIGSRVVLAKDASGLKNGAVLAALDRKGYVTLSGAHDIVVTKKGLEADTGLRERILHGSDH